MHTSSCSQNLKVGDYLGDRHRWEIILKYAVKKHDGKTWSGLIWDRTEIIGRLL
jgi:hypothetical protein